MDCQQVREALEQLVESGQSFAYVPELEEHLVTCVECQRWYTRELQAISALDTLEPIPVPDDFTGRVLSRLPDIGPESRTDLATPAKARASTVREVWSSFLDALDRLAPGKRLMPALAVAASLLLVLGLLYGLQASDVPSTPGAAVGAFPWGIAVLLSLVFIGLVVGLVLWRRKG
jgi:hypothetical protein